jgi:hypothetical protein
MSVRYIRPPNLLAKKLLAAAPQSTQMALRKAQTNLVEMSDACLEEVDVNLSNIERLLGMWPAEPDVGYMSLLYEQGLRIYGVASVAGLPWLDEATYGFCDLVDVQIATSNWSREPIAVHVSSMRLLRQRGMPEQDARAILDGLAHVRRRFAPPKPAQAGTPEA